MCGHHNMPKKKTKEAVEAFDGSSSESERSSDSDAGSSVRQRKNKTRGGKSSSRHGGSNRSKRTAGSDSGSDSDVDGAVAAFSEEAIQVASTLVQANKKSKTPRSMFAVFTTALVSKKSDQVMSSKDFGTNVVAFAKKSKKKIDTKTVQTCFGEFCGGKSATTLAFPTFYRAIATASTEAAGFVKPFVDVEEAVFAALKKDLKKGKTLKDSFAKAKVPVEGSMAQDLFTSRVLKKILPSLLKQKKAITSALFQIFASSLIGLDDDDEEDAVSVEDFVEFFSTTPVAASSDDEEEAQKKKSAQSKKKKLEEKESDSDAEDLEEKDESADEGSSADEGEDQDDVELTSPIQIGWKELRSNLLAEKTKVGHLESLLSVSSQEEFLKALKTSKLKQDRSKKMEDVAMCFFAEADDDEQIEAAGGAVDFVFSIGTCAPGTYTAATYKSLIVLHSEFNSTSKSLLGSTKSLSRFTFKDLEKADSKKTGMCSTVAFKKALSKVEDQHVDAMVTAYGVGSGKKTVAYAALARALKDSDHDLKKGITSEGLGVLKNRLKIALRAMKNKDIVAEYASRAAKGALSVDDFCHVSYTKLCLPVSQHELHLILNGKPNLKGKKGVHYERFLEWVSSTKEEEIKEDKKHKNEEGFKLISDALVAALKAYSVAQKGKCEDSIKKVFAKVGPKLAEGKDHMVDFKSFEKGLKAMKIKIPSAEDLSVLMDSFNSEQDGRIRVQEFASFVAGLSTDPAVSQAMNALRTAVIGKLKGGVDNAAIVKHVTKSFSSMVDEDDGTIGLDDFKKHVAKAYKIAKGDCATLGSVFDQNKDGEISFKEFLSTLFPDQKADEVLRSIQTRLLALERVGKKARDIFKHFDKNDDGKITIVEFLGGLKEQNFPIDESLAWQVIVRLDKDGDGEISPSEFAALLKEKLPKKEESSDDSDGEGTEDSDNDGEDKKRESKEAQHALLPALAKRRLWDGGAALAAAKKMSSRSHILTVFKQTMGDGESVPRAAFLATAKSKLKEINLKDNQWEQVCNAFSIDDEHADINVVDFAVFVATPIDAHAGKSGVGGIAAKIRPGLVKQFQKENESGQNFATYDIMIKKYFKDGGGNASKGTVSTKKCAAIFQKLCPSVALSAEEVDALNKRFAVRGNFNFIDFIYYIDPVPDVERLLKKLKIKMKVFERRGKSFEDIFLLASEGGEDTNVLSREKFKQFLLFQCGLPLTESDISGLMYRLDSNGDDEIDLDEFLAAIDDAGKKKKGNSAEEQAKAGSPKPAADEGYWEDVLTLILKWAAVEENLAEFEDEVLDIAGEDSTVVNESDFIDCLITAKFSDADVNQLAAICDRFRAKSSKKGSEKVDFELFLVYVDDEASKAKKNDKKGAADKDKKGNKDGNDTKEKVKEGDKRSKENVKKVEKKESPKEKKKESPKVKKKDASKTEAGNKFKAGDMCLVDIEDDDTDTVEIIKYDSGKKVYVAKYDDGEEDEFAEEELRLKPAEKKKPVAPKTKAKEPVTKPVLPEEDESSEEEEEEDDDDDSLSVDEWYKKHQDKAFDRAFKEIDTDGSGLVDAIELGAALRAMGQKPTDEEVHTLIADADQSGTGSIDKTAFRKLMKSKLGRQRHKEKQEKAKATLETIRELFDEIDADKSGSLEEGEFKILLLKRMRIMLTPREFKGLVKEIDLDQSGTIEFEEFRELWNDVESMQQDARSTRVMGADAERAVQKISKGPIEDPREYLKAFSGMPANFRPSVLAQLSSDDRHSFDHVLSGAKDEGLSKEVLTAQSTGKKAHWDPKNRKAALSAITVNIKVNEASGIPVPDDTYRKNVVKRELRVCLMRGDPSDMDEKSKSGQDRFVGNQHIIPVSWNSSAEDEWNFTKATTGLGSKKMTLRNSDADAKEMFVLFELTVTVAKGEDSSSTFEMAVGWCVLSMSKALAASSSTTHKLDIQGGSLDEATEIRPGDIMQRRSGFGSKVGHFLKHGGGGAKPVLKVTIDPILAADQVYLSSLPPTIICSQETLPLLYVHRYMSSNCFGEAHTAWRNGEDEENEDDNDDEYDRRGMRRKSSKRRGSRGPDRTTIEMATPTFGVHSPALKIFPKILDTPALLGQLMRKKAIKNLKAIIRKSMGEAERAFTESVIDLWPQVCIHDPKENIDLAAKMNTKAGNSDRPFMRSDDRDDGSGTFLPFSIDEVAMETPDTACAVNSLNHLILASITGVAKKPRKTNSRRRDGDDGSDGDSDDEY